MPRRPACNAGDGCRPIAQSRGPDLLHGYTADHAGPVVVGTPEIVRPRPTRRKEDVFSIARLHQNLGARLVEDIGVIDIRAAKERWRRELMGFGAVILQMQPIMNIVLEG